MLKKIAIACAGFVLAGQTALFAQSANPLDVPSQPAAEQPVVPAPAKLQTYIGEIDGIPVVLQVRGANNAASGFLIVGSERCALTATINGPTLEGTWQAASGKSYAFRATISGQGVVTLETNGKSLTLRSPSAPMTQPSNLGDGPAPAPAPAPAPKPANDAGGDASLDKVGVKIGQYFTAPLPNGWQMMDGPIGAFIGSADRKSAFGVIGRPLQDNEGFTTFSANVLRDLGVTNPTSLSGVDLKVDGGEGREMVLSFTTADGVRRTGIFRVVVLNKGTRNIGMVWHAATTEDLFRANIAKMMQLATSIQMNPESIQQPQQPAVPQQPQAPQANGGNNNPLNF